MRVQYFNNTNAIYAFYSYEAKIDFTLLITYTANVKYITTSRITDIIIFRLTTLENSLINLKYKYKK